MLSVPKPLLWAWAVATAALYGVLAYGSYVTLPSLAGGVLGFDMRPLGMPVDLAAPYIQGLTSAARDYYFGTLRPLDTAFIAALVMLSSALARRFGGRFFWLSFGAALVYGASDLIENRLVGEAMAVSFQTEAAAHFEAITFATRIKFAALALLVASLVFQWRRSHAQR